MKKVDVINIKGEKTKDIQLNETVWGIEPNDTVLYDALSLARNNARQGTADTKTRAEVSGGGRKPWRQKGTGRARHGSTRSPIWRTGGITFGPHPRDYSIKMNRKERRLALKSALAYKVKENNLIVIDNFILETNKTKDTKKLLENFQTGRKVLIVVEELTDNVILGTRNLKNILLLGVDEINTYDIVTADTMIITSKAVEMLEGVFAQ